MANSNEKKISMEHTIRKYFEGCNESSYNKMVSCFVKDAVHYFPPDMYDGPWIGASKIANGWIEAVKNIGSYWTIDNLILPTLILALKHSTRSASASSPCTESSFLTS